MKSFGYIAIVLSAVAGCTSLKIKKDSVEINSVIQDTFFIKKEIRDHQPYHAIYIDSTKEKSIIDSGYGLDEQDSLNMQSYLKALSKKNIGLSRHNTYGLTSEWLPVYRFNAKYYLYVPSDSGSKRHAIITDSLLMIHYMDGYVPSVIKSVERKTDHIYKVRGINDPEISTYDGGLSELNIYVVDKEKMLTVWEYSTNSDKKNTIYQLMIPKESVRYFPIIVNKSIEKQKEVDFDQIDFLSMIAKAK